MDRATITVNGKVYDMTTGMPIVSPTGAPAMRPSANRQTRSSHQVHQKMQPAKTSRRRAPEAPTHEILKRPSAQRNRPVATAPRSPAVTKFASQLHQDIKKLHVVNDIRPASTHPLVKKANSRLQPVDKKQSSAVTPASVIKKQAIDEAMNKAPAHKAPPVNRSRRTPRLISLASIALSMLMLVGYFTYINLPNLSVRVAASQAGIDASYPGYRPDGYRLAGVNYDEGSVSLKFTANAGSHKFTITQQQTNWDSSAVRENYVHANWGDDVVPYSERGLTIYSHGSNAAWVNGGILYTITGDAPLSTSQVRNIATSL